MEEASGWNHDENLLAEVFNQCDRDGSGYITRDELAALCRSYERQDEGGFSPGGLDALMATLDVDNDGHISFEEFKAGFQSYSASHLAPDDSLETMAVKSSTPKHMLANEEVYESAVESEFSWNEAANRVDPDGLLEGMGVENVWSELASQEPNMLEPFENFLSEVVLQMQHNKQDKHELQNHIKKIMAQHSREVSEMEQILEEQVLRAQEDTQKKNTSRTRQLSSHYSSLLAEREAQIERLEAKETSLQRTLDDKVSSETLLKQERRRLINANEELSQQLTSPPMHRPSSSNLDDQLVQQWVEPVSEDNINFSPPVKSRDHVSEREESLPRSIMEGEAIENSNLVERPRPLGEDGSLTSPITTELPPQPQTSPPVVNRVFKVAFLGDSGVGKTSLILRLCEGRFNASCASTLGLDFSTKMLTVGEERVVFQLWDTAGQERFRNALTPVYFRRADAFVIVYDVTNWKSFKSSKSWLSIVSAALREQPPVVMLVGNKTDKQEKREVTLDDGHHLALELHALFSEMSALSGDNVLQAHTTLAQLLLKRENEHLETVKNKALEITSENKRKCSC